MKQPDELKPEMVEEVDVETFGKQGKPPPPARKYVIRIDKQKHLVDHPIVTGRQLLTLAGKNPPERFEIFQKLHGGQVRKIELDEQVNLAAPGIECFKTIPLEVTEG